MPHLALANGAEIYYEEYGSGFPLLLLAPGGLRSRIALWRSTHEGKARPWADPTAAFSDTFRVIALDQRNAGSSRAPITTDDGWHSYAEDHLGVLDALGIDRFHVLGSCISASFALKLIEVAPERVASAVLQQPIGLVPGKSIDRAHSFEKWATTVREKYPDTDEAALEGLRRNLYSGDFVYSVTRDFVRTIKTPLLVLGVHEDNQHPIEIARELAELAPNVRFNDDWRGVDKRDVYVATVRDFLLAATPAG